MKKFLTFFALACLTVVGAWAQQITDLADITAGKQVYIKRNDGAYYINIANATATTATLQSTPSLITLVDAGDGSFYFYNEDTRLYVGITGTDATTAPSASSTADAGKFTFMTSYGTNTAPNGVFYIHVDNGQRGGGNTDFLNKNNGQPNSIMTWSLSGNSYCQWVVSVPEMIDVVVNGAPSGTEVSILGETYTDGGKIPAGTTITASDVTPADITGYKHFVSIVGNSVIVNYVADPNLTDLYVHSVGAKASTMTPGQWYILTQTRDYESPAMDNGLGNVISRSTTKLSDLDLPVNTPAANIAQYLVRFVASGVGNTYNIQFGTGRFFANQDNKAPANGVSAVSSETNVYNFLVATAGASGFDLGATNDGTTRSGFGMDNSNTTSTPPHYLNFWKSNAGGGNNTWYLYPVEFGEYLNTTTVTYNYYYNGTLKTTKTSTQEIGATVAAPASIHIFTANEYDESAVVSADLVVDVTVKDATPFVAAESYDKIEHWYAMQIRENNWLYNTGTSPVTGTSTYEISAKYAWGFVGNIYDGYVIYNKEAGDAVALDSNTPCTISAAGTSVIWSIPRVGTLGDASFGLKTEGQDPINWQSNQLKRWGGFDLGSSFRLEEVYLGEHEYTVNITGGAPEGTKVTINGNEYADGETVTMDAATATVVPATVSLYNAVVAYNGLNININYVACGIKTMTEIVQGQAYTITSGGTRGAFVINNEKLTSTYKAGVTASATDANQQFLFVQHDGKYYLYSVGADKFISLAEDGNSTVLTDEPVDTDIQFLENQHSSKQTNPVVLQMDEHHLGISNGYDPAVITTWKSTNDEGNSLRIWPVEATIDMDAILAKFTPAPTGVEITIGATGYATMAYNETIVNKPEGLKAYYCINEGEAGHLTPVEWEKDYIPGYCAYILEGTPNTTYTVDCVDTDTFEYPDTDYDAMYDIYMNNVLIGNFDDTDMDVEDAKADYGENIYVFSKKNEVLGFYQFAGATLAAHKAFFATEEASVQGFTLDFGGQTVGVNSVISAANLKAGYDIQGRRINKIQKGINVINGKKIIK